MNCSAAFFPAFRIPIRIPFIYTSRILYNPRTSADDECVFLSWNVYLWLRFVFVPRSLLCWSATLLLLRLIVSDADPLVICWYRLNVFLEYFVYCLLLWIHRPSFQWYMLSYSGLMTSQFFIIIETLRKNMSSKKKKKLATQ